MGTWERLNDEIVQDSSLGVGVKTLTERMPVPGGWIYRAMTATTGNEGGKSVSVALTFVPSDKDKIPPR